MKRTALVSAVLLGTLMSSCKKETKTTTPPPSGGTLGTLTAENYGFDGGRSGKFSSTKAGFTQQSAAGVSTFMISAIRDGGSESITIVLLHAVKDTGVYQIGSDYDNGGIEIMKDYTKPGDLTQTYSTDNDGNTMHGGGEIRITKVDGSNVEGTFYAVGFNSTGKESFAEQGSFKGAISK